MGDGAFQRSKHVRRKHSLRDDPRILVALRIEIAGVVAFGDADRPMPELLRDPSAINVDPYGDGWMFEMCGSDQMLLTPEDYLEHLASVWQVTQRTIRWDS